MKKLICWLVIAVVAVFVIQNPAGADALAHRAAAAVTAVSRSLSRLVAGL